MSSFSYVSHVSCSKNCSQPTPTYSVDKINNLCLLCGAPLLVHYDLKKVKEEWKKESLIFRAPSLWRYHEVLPIKDPQFIVSLGEGWTPLWKAEKLGKGLDLDSLFIKDEGLLPTGTFKARGAAVGVSKARELNIKTIALPSNGNAGASWCAYSARASISVLVAMPKDAPPLAVEEVVAYNAKAYFVDGQITDAGRMIGEVIKKSAGNIFDASTLKEPYRIEGKKTMGYEIAEQFGWEVPDVIIYPTGGGVGLIGIYKAFEELREIGWIDKDKPLPKMVCVQAKNCAPIVKAWKEGKTVSEKWENAQTIAQGIRVPKALGDFLVLDICKKSNGTCVDVEDELIMEMWHRAAREEGVFLAPEGAATIAAAKLLRENNFLKKEDKIVLLNTGTGFKYPGLVKPNLEVLPVDGSIPGY